MTVSRDLAATVTDTSYIESINISEAHSSSTAIATVKAFDTDLDIGDDIAVNLGYTDNCPEVFTGYVKRIEKSSPDELYTITANDVMVRAIDYFIVGANPEQPYTYNNITGEALITEVMQMAGLYDLDIEPTNFTFGINNPVEVNLVSSYDYAKMICDLLAYELWADPDGTIRVANRKPYVMIAGSPDEHQPGFHADPWDGYPSLGTFEDTGILNLTIGVHEKDLRNKIVVYGKDELSASASSAESYDPLIESSRQILPDGYYKAAVLASPLIEDGTFAQNACDYNLALYNRLSYELPLTLEGSPSIHARRVLTINSSIDTDINKMWYVFQMDHAWGKGGFTTNLLLRR